MNFKTIFSLLLLFSFTSCFEIVEDISFKKDGSGVLKLILNLSQSKNEINTLMKLDSSSGYNIPTESDINSYLDRALQKLKSIEGLSNVSINRDFKNWIFEVKTNFKNGENLEKAIQSVHSEFAKEEPLLFKNWLMVSLTLFSASANSGKSVEIFPVRMSSAK